MGWSWLKTVLLQEPPEAEHLPVRGSELLLQVAGGGEALGSFLAEPGRESVHDAAIGVRAGGGGCRRGLACLLGAQGLDAAAEAGAGVKEVEADAAGAGDGPEADVLLGPDQLADGGLSARGSGVVLCPGRAAQRVGSALGRGSRLARVSANVAHGVSGPVVMVTGTGLSW